MAYCHLGSHPIEPGQRVYAQVIGWAKPGKGLNGQSGSSLVLRERTGHVACIGCVTRALYGVTPEQMTLDEVTL